MQRWDSLVIKPDFILDERIEPLCRYFAKELQRAHSQSGWSSKKAFSFYRFPATEEFWDIVRHDGNRAFLETVHQDFDVSPQGIRLHCRRKFSVTGTHFDGQCNYVFGVCLSGEKLWSVKKVNYWDLLRHNYLPAVKHNTYDAVAHGEGVLWYDKDQLHGHEAGSLLFLPPGWFHTVVYTTDVVSFDISLIPKRKLAGGVSPYSVPFLYGSRGAEHGEDHTGPVHWALRHGLHAASDLLRLGLFPAYLARSLASRVSTPARVARVTARFAPVPDAPDGSPALRQIDLDCLQMIEELIHERSARRALRGRPERTHAALS